MTSRATLVISPARPRRYLQESGIADTCYVGPEPEFFIFDEVRYEQNQHKGYYEIDSVEGAWNTARIEEPNLVTNPASKAGTFRSARPTPTTIFAEKWSMRCARSASLSKRTITRWPPRGRARSTCTIQPLLKMADQFMWYKYICKNVARRRGKTVTFMPKPIFEDNGSGMHTHISLWKGSTPLFAGDRYAGLSELGLHAAGGLLKHAPAILAFAAPDDQLLLPPGPGLRGAGQPGAVRAESLGLDPHSDVLEESQGEAA